MEVTSLVVAAAHMSARLLRHPLMELAHPSATLQLPSQFSRTLVMNGFFLLAFCILDAARHRLLELPLRLPIVHGRRRLIVTPSALLSLSFVVPIDKGHQANDCPSEKLLALYTGMDTLGLS